MSRIKVNPKVIEWACERSGKSLAALEESFKSLPLWRTGEKLPTLKQLESFAGATLTPLGALLLDEPPTEKLPVPDFRTVGDRQVRRLTAPLLETIYLMQRRQEWLREYLKELGAEPLPFVGSVTPEADPDAVAGMIREALGMNLGWAAEHSTWEEALLGLRRAAEALRIMVVINGCVGNNTHAPLDPKDFRGFVLSDRMAPLIFINGADWNSAQMFTLAHELAHLWVGRGAVFNLENLQPSNDAVEKFCNHVAAEVLVPEAELRAVWPKAVRDGQEFRFVARHFKVSQVVAARRALDLGLINRGAFFTFLKSWGDDEAEAKRKQKEKQKEQESGLNFYKTQGKKIGHLFGGMVVRAAREGRILYQDAYRLTGLHGSTFDRFSTAMGFDRP